MSSWRTSSNLARVDTCPASIVLERFPHSGVESAQGTKNHEAAERGELKPYLKSLTLECVESTVRREVSFVLDVKKRAVVRMADGARNYGELGKWELGTTPDFFGELPRPRTWRVRDWKSRKLVTTPRDNLQVISQALSIFASRGAAIVDAGLGYLAHDADDAHTFTIFDVPVMWARLESVLERGHNAKPDQVHESEQCTYCPCLTTCPAKKALATVFGVDIEATVAAMTAAQVGELYRKTEALEKLVARAYEVIEARGRHEPIPLGGGRRLALIQCRGRLGWDHAKVEAFLKANGLKVEEFKKRGADYTQFKETKS